MKWDCFLIEYWWCKPDTVVTPSLSLTKLFFDRTSGNKTVNEKILTIFFEKGEEFAIHLVCYKEDPLWAIFTALKFRELGVLISAREVDLHISLRLADSVKHWRYISIITVVIKKNTWVRDTQSCNHYIWLNIVSRVLYIWKRIVSSQFLIGWRYTFSVSTATSIRGKHF